VLEQRSGLESACSLSGEKLMLGAVAAGSVCCSFRGDSTIAVMLIHPVLGF